MIKSIPLSETPACNTKQYRKREGRCYALGFDFIQANPDGWTLVHATLYPPEGPIKRLSGSFVENGKVVYDPVLDRFFDREWYYLYYSITGAHKYTREEASDQLLERHHYGPWHRKLPDQVRTGFTFIEYRIIRKPADEIHSPGLSNGAEKTTTLHILPIESGFFLPTVFVARPRSDCRGPRPWQTARIIS